jgi:hypothetical protein
MYGPLLGGGVDGTDGNGVSGQKRRIATVLRNDQGEQRKFLKVFETLGPQLWNAYGEGKYNRMKPSRVVAPTSRIP